MPQANYLHPALGCPSSTSLVRAIAWFVMLLSTVSAQAQAARRWDFNHSGDLEGWVVPQHAFGVVQGGSLWVTLEPKDRKAAAHQFQGETGGDFISSPSALQIPASQVTQVRMRVLNLSPLTDYFLVWKTKERGWGPALSNYDWGQPQQSRRCTLKAYEKQWQETICYIDQRWEGTIEQIAIRSAGRMVHGDLWIDWLEMAKGPGEPARARPDVASTQVVPKISIPGISQEGFAEAFQVLDKGLITDVPIYGFPYPVISAGGHYNKGGWWQFDSSAAVIGAKWANQRFAEDVMRGFQAIQAENTNGRIGQWGLHGRSPANDLSSLPVFFEVAYDIARRSENGALREEIYESMRRYLDWWLSPVKRDAATGLITGYGEEAFGDDSWSHSWNGGPIAPKTLAPVDTNVLVAVGAARTAELADAQGKKEEAARYRQVFQELSQAINTYMWDEAHGTYHNYDLRNHARRVGLNVSTFDPLRLGIAPPARRNRLLKRLLDPAQFNWGKRPLTSWAMTDPRYAEVRSDFTGDSWVGSIWTVRNMAVIAGLEESGRADLAAELNWDTIKTFHSNYYEFVAPSDGKGFGAEEYAMSASHYIAAVVEHLFGVDFDCIEKRLSITPHVPKALYGKALALENLILPTEGNPRLSLLIKQSSAKAVTITARITGPLPEGLLHAGLPGTDKNLSVPMRRNFNVRFP